jgi:hypothetical protein
MKNKSIVLTDDQMVKALKNFIDECDADTLCQIMGDVFGGSCVLTESDSSDNQYEFTPDENYGGGIDGLEIPEPDPLIGKIYKIRPELEGGVTERLGFRYKVVNVEVNRITLEETEIGSHYYATEEELAYHLEEVKEESNDHKI